MTSPWIALGSGTTWSGPESCCWWTRLLTSCLVVCSATGWPTLNLRRVDVHAVARAAWAGRVDFADFDTFDESALVAETVRDGLGYHAVKSRASVPLRVAFLAAATDAVLANRLCVVGRAGAGHRSRRAGSCRSPRSHGHPYPGVQRERGGRVCPGAATCPDPRSPGARRTVDDQ